MEKKVRVKRLNHQDDVKRSWAAAYSITEEFESEILPDDWQETQADTPPEQPDREALPERYRPEQPNEE
jgi:hypothetical protein